MHLGAQALVVGLNAQETLAADIHGHAGIERAVILLRVGADDPVGASGSQDHVSTGGAIGLTALIYIVKNHGRSHGAGDIQVVQNQRHHGVGIILGVFTQIHGDLAKLQLTAEDIGSGGVDVDDGVGLARFALAVTGFIIKDVVGGGDGVLRHTVGSGDGQRAVLELDANRSGILRHGFRGRDLDAGSTAARQQPQCKDHAKQFFHGKPSPFLFWLYYSISS